MALTSSYIMRICSNSLMHKRIVMVVFASAMLAALIVKGRQTGKPPGLATLSAIPKPFAVIQISGDVRHPGSYEVTDNKMTDSVIQMADPLCDNQAATLERLLSINLTTSNSFQIICKDHKNKPVIKAGSIKPSQCLTLGIPLDINQMTAADFEMLPGVGPVLANRIVVFRQKNGDFESLAALLQVEGVGEKKFQHLSRYFKVPILHKK